jgi:hypothetical protein
LQNIGSLKMTIVYEDYGKMIDKQANEIPDSRRNVAAMRARAETLRQAAKSAKLAPVDQTQVAVNLWGILARGERRGVRRAEVLQKANKGTKADSTKRLERYALNPELPAEERTRRAAKLTKGAAPYLDIAEAAGLLIESDADVFVADLFARTRIGEATPPAPEVDDIYAELADLVRDICRGIVQKHDLAACARRIETWRMCRYRNSLRECRWISWPSVWQGIGSGAKMTGLVEREGGWSLPYPNLLVGWGIVQDDLPFRVSKEPRNSSAGDGRVPLVGQDGTQIRRLGKLLAEVRIALLPIGPGGTIEPAFVTRLRTFIKLGHITRGPDDRLSYAPYTDAEMHLDAKLSFSVADRTPYLGEASELKEVSQDVNVSSLPKAIYHYYKDTTNDLVFEPEFSPDSISQLFEKFEGSEKPRGLSDDEASDDFQRIELVSPSSCRKLLSLEVNESPETHTKVGTVVDDTEPSLSELEDPLEYWSKQGVDPIDVRDEYASRAEPWTLGESLEFSLLFANTMGHKGNSFDEVLDATCTRVVNEVTSRARSLEEDREERKVLKRQIWTSEKTSAICND